MAGNSSDLFIYGDDFDTILELLQEDEEIEYEINQAVDNVSAFHVLFL